MTREYNQRSQQNQLLSLCKKDDLNNPDSCSGISLVTIVSKVFASIIRERLADKQLLEEAQAGAAFSWL